LARCSPARSAKDASRICAAIWHLDEVFVKINGKLCYLWRAVDHEGEVLEAVVTSKRDKAVGSSFANGS
jgi:putative transposase